MRSILLLMVLSTTVIAFAQNNLTFQIKHQQKNPLNGRLLLLLSTNENSEPRNQITSDYRTQMVFGLDVEAWDNSQMQKMPTADVFGYPLQTLDEIKPGIYYVQAFLNIYEKFELSTGHKVLLPPDKGEGQKWNIKPGNIYSKVQKVEVIAGQKTNAQFVLDQIIPPIPEPEDTDYVKHVKIKSELLSKFWGKDTYIGAHVLIPHNFAKDSGMKYPLMVFHGHFPSDFGGWETTPPPSDMDTSDYSPRFGIYGYKKFQLTEGHEFYKQWTSDTFPRFLAIEVVHPTPYYDDSYAVNSASQGPYGDAITYELIPYIEKTFRGIGQGWARFLYGGSTGGWEALAAQMFYPNEYNGCFAACPDPIDFRAFTVIDIYNDANAYMEEGPVTTIERPAHRDYLGHISSTVRQSNYYELALGTKTRSGEQWDIWEATYSPMGPEGYPMRLWDKKTGVINKEVANYWKENYDLGYILKRDWDKLGPQLKGKIHIYCGDMDNYYLNNAVYLVEDFLKQTKNPFYGGEVTYGDRAEHCWNGDPNLPNYITRLRYNTMYLPKILKRVAVSAPKGSDLRWMNQSKLSKNLINK
ncbi:MAG: alpha/beta hydrolase-fold protein [Saprospiraceae bacterium]